MLNAFGILWLRTSMGKKCWLGRLWQARNVFWLSMLQPSEGSQPEITDSYLSCGKSMVIRGSKYSHSLATNSTNKSPAQMQKSKNTRRNAWKLSFQCLAKSAQMETKLVKFINTCVGTVVCLIRRRIWPDRCRGTSQSFWSVLMEKLLCTLILAPHPEISFHLS